MPNVSNPSKVLLVESHPELIKKYREMFQPFGDVAVLSHCQSFLQLLEQGESNGVKLANFKLLLTDGADPECLVRCLSHQNAKSYIESVIVVSNHDDIYHINRVLDLGVNYYFTRPFNINELLAKAKRLFSATVGMRENQGDHGGSSDNLSAAGSVSHNEFKFDAISGNFTLRNHEPIKLTRIEYGILMCLVRSPEHRVSRVKIMQEVWGESEYNRKQEVHVSHLRSKIKQVGLNITFEKGDMLILTDANNG